MQPDLSLTRREMVEQALRASVLPGAALFFSAFFSASAQQHTHAGRLAAPPDPEGLRNYTPVFFSPEDFKAFQSFADLLIPSDDTPGALEAYCPQYIDFVLSASSEVPQTQANWRKAMQAIKDSGFYTADKEKRMELILEMSRPELDQNAQHAAYFAYRLIKQQTAFAFYTSRKGMIEALDYRGNSYNIVFPACNHPEHQVV